MVTTQIRVPLWDEDGRAVLDHVVVRGRPDKIKKIEEVLEYTLFIARRGGEPREQAATEFLRRHKVGR